MFALSCCVSPYSIGLHVDLDRSGSAMFALSCCVSPFSSCMWLMRLHVAACGYRSGLAMCALSCWVSISIYD